MTIQRLWLTSCFHERQEVIESNIGVTGACLPILRQPFTQWFPQWFATKRSTNKYYDARWTDDYALQNVSNGQTGGSQQYARHNVSVSGGDLFRSNLRKSDEMGIIEESWESRDADSGYEQDSVPGRTPRDIRKNVSVSVRRT